MKIVIDCTEKLKEKELADKIEAEEALEKLIAAAQRNIALRELGLEEKILDKSKLSSVVDTLKMEVNKTIK